jgi:hypothetical protein
MKSRAKSWPAKSEWFTGKTAGPENGFRREPAAAGA